MSAPGIQLLAVEERLHIFADYLRRIDIEVAPGSALDQVTLDLMEENAVRSGTAQLVNPGEFRQRRLRIVSLFNLATLVLSRTEHQCAAAMMPHLRLLADATRPSSVAPTAPGPAGDQAAQKLFELVAGCIAMGASDWVELDDPTGQGRHASNPDVMFRYRGQSWGIACKTPDSQNTMTYLDRVEEGVHQVEVSSVDRGFVLINLRNLIPADMLWPRSTLDGATPSYESFSDSDAPRLRLKEAVQGLRDRIVNEGHLDRIAVIFQGRKKALPLLMQYAFGSALVRSEGEPRTQPISLLHATPFAVGSPEPPDDAFVDRLLRDFSDAAKWTA